MSLFDGPAFEEPKGPPKKRAAPAWRPPTDRGSRRGAKRCIVTEQLAIIDHQVAKASGIKGEFFQSRKEAKHYVYLEIERRHARLRPLPNQTKWRQVNFALYTTNPAGLKVKICDLRLDFAYEWFDATTKAWTTRHEDVKPGGGLREDTYLLKRKWFEAQYGIKILEL